MRLIQVNEAAKRLGVHRQTLENWGKDGTLKIIKSGKTNKAHWVDADTIDALGDTVADTEHAKEMVEKEHKKWIEEWRKERDAIQDIRREMRLVGKFGSHVFAREFYLSIPTMLHSIGKINARECKMMKAIIEGKDMMTMADEMGVTRTRAVQIFLKGCRKARCLERVREDLAELEQLRSEVTELRKEVRILSEDLKVQREAEEQMQKMEEAELIKYIEETDNVLQLYNTRLVDMDAFNVRALNCFRGLNIDTLGELIKMGRTDLLKCRTVGRGTLNHIEEVLEMLGLDFNTDVDKIHRERIALRMKEMKLKDNLL